MYILAKGKFCVNREQKLQTHGRGAKTLSQSLRHLDKHKQAADIEHPELSHLNRTLIANEQRSFKYIAKKLDQCRAEYDKMVDEWNEAGNTPKKRHMQSRAAQSFEGVLTFSPEMTDKIDINKWVQANISFLKREFQDKGCSAVRVELHMDEETPHIHFVFVCTGKNGIYMAKDILGNRGDLSKLQDRYAEAMKPFDLERGYSRYNEYLNIRRRAISAGYGNSDGTITQEQMQEYADDNGITLPKRRRHTTTRQWKAEVEVEVKDLESQKTKLTDEINQLEQSKDKKEKLIKRLKDQVKEITEKIEYYRKNPAEFIFRDDDDRTPSPKEHIHDDPIGDDILGL